MERKWMVRTPVGDYVVWATDGTRAKHLVWRMTRGRIEKSEMVVERGEEV